MPERRRSLSRRLALWIALCTALSSVVFAVVAYIVVSVEEHQEISTGEVEDTEGDARREVLIAMAFAAPVGLALATIGAVVITRRALRPVDQVIREVSALDAGRVHERVTVPTRDDELRALTLSLNGLLERLDRGYGAIAMFAAAASHELRTPLAVVSSELEVALRRPRSVGEWETSARTSLDELRRLARLVDALLGLTRSDSERASVVDVAVDQLVEPILAAHAAAATSAGVTVTSQLADDRVRGDEIALASALGNVLGNAIRYTPRGGQVAITSQRKGATLHIVVDDTGPGVPPAELERIFLPFARAASDTSGFGLGLAIARRIAERHGGTLTATNRPTGGASFTFELPAASCTAYKV